MTFDYNSEFDRYVERIKIQGDSKYKVIVDTHGMFESEVSQRYGVDDDVSDEIHRMNKEYYDRTVRHLKQCGVIQ